MAVGSNESQAFCSGINDHQIKKRFSQVIVENVYRERKARMYQRLVGEWRSEE